jgi:structural maintenance of chromosome 2
MRASNQTDLIYKRGQASVTIALDNSVAFSSECDQVAQWTQGSTTNYSITVSVHPAQYQQPNFVIMQGKITKAHHTPIASLRVQNQVLNMRPQEILSMVEEAAGTRMFEDRKDKAIKTMSKKDKKVQEITSLLAEEITPKLDKLRKEKRKFIELQKAETEL